MHIENFSHLHHRIKLEATIFEPFQNQDFFDLNNPQPMNLLK